MSTPKPGQIRCPTCLRSTPPAAFCTQCGSPIPASARVRPRGMDRDELEERIRSRRPDDAGFRRGMPVDDASVFGDPTRPQGYVPFEPEPEDALAAREPDAGAPTRYFDNTPADFDAERPVPPLPRGTPPPVLPEEPPPKAYRPHEAEPLPPPQPTYTPPPAYSAPTSYAAPPPLPPEPSPPEYEAADDDRFDQAEPEYEPEEAYPYTYPQRGDDDGRRGGGALPIIGFIALCALALAVGAVLAGVFSSGDVARTTPSPSASAPSATPEPSLSITPPASETPGTSATPEPSDGPVTFPDGTIITVQPCATRDMSFDGCDVDGSVVSGDLWVWIGFDDALGSDTFTLELRAAGQTIDQQQKVLGEILDCPDRCGGYLIGAAYRDLGPGEYELVIRRNGDFADRATFTVEG
jgi:hypothetical protein